jgi:hypothetical protein
MNNLSCEDFLALLPENDPIGREWYCNDDNKVYVRRSSSILFVVMDEETVLGFICHQGTAWIVLAKDYAVINSFLHPDVAISCLKPPKYGWNYSQVFHKEI